MTKDQPEDFEAAHNALKGAAILMPKSAAEWGPYRAFLAVATSASLDEAARSLNVSAATLKRRVERLEAMFQTRLYQSVSGVIKLTPVGRGIAKKIARADEMLEGAMSLNQPTLAHSRTPLRLSLNPTTFQVVIKPLMRDNPAIFDKYRVKFSGLFRREWRELVQADVNFGAMLGDGTTMVSFPIGTARYSFYASDAYIAERGKPTVDRLGSHKMISARRLGVLGSVWLEVLAIEKRCGNSVQTDDFLEAHELIGAGVGFGICSHPLKQPNFQELEGFPKFDLPLQVSFDAEFFQKPSNKPLIDLIITSSRQIYKSE